MRSTDILIVGAGPAGIAAAVCASECGRRVTVLDDNPAPGGQIWRGRSPLGRRWFERLDCCGATVLNATRVFDGDARNRCLHVETASESFELRYHRLILATGAREFFLPFPGWTLPNVIAAGGLQSLVKNGLPIKGKRILVAGSGPLLLAVAAYLRRHGAIVPLIVEQANWSRLFRFGFDLLRDPGKLSDAIGLRTSLAASSYVTGAWVQRAEGAGSHFRVRLSGRPQPVSCDYLAISYGLRPNTELAQYLGCRLQDGAVAVDEFQQTSLDRIYCAGEVCGIGGVDLALIEGQIAGYAVAGRRDPAVRMFAARARAQRFADNLNRTIAPRMELHDVPDVETIVCRCEDVRFGRLRDAGSWRAAKLHSRCGMGPCQGRICGPAVQFLFGWQPESIRAPILPARILSLIAEEKEG
jgi:D-hydroxyproline dehydrogenase subunit alpha